MSETKMSAQLKNGQWLIWDGKNINRHDSDETTFIETIATFINASDAAHFIAMLTVFDLRGIPLTHKVIELAFEKFKKYAD